MYMNTGTSIQRMNKLMAKMGLRELSDFADYTAEDVAKHKGIGRKTLRVLREALAEHGVVLKGDPPLRGWHHVLTRGGMSFEDALREAKAETSGRGLSQLQLWLMLDALSDRYRATTP